ncbi:hypothetical protein BC834DRAFT_969056 [Gloeopeniophorella convolvens]|nr:hypothetical protein BC834DRAFT_969056 [Gloeopeniophorella convolvens]
MHLSDIPVEILLHNLFPIASIDDILKLGCTSKFFASICSDDAFWKGRCRTDFANLANTGVFSRKTGWKALHQALSFPRVFVWGYLDKGTRGIGKNSQFHRNAGPFPYPVEVPFPRVRIVSLVACDRSFQALDSQGSVWVWGTLTQSWGDIDGVETDEIDDEIASEMFHLRKKTVYGPHKLDMPSPVTAIRRARQAQLLRDATPNTSLPHSCGGMQAVIVDSAARFWTLLNWEDPFRLKSPFLDGKSPETTPLRIACGRCFAAILTHSGDVFVFWWMPSREARTRSKPPYVTEDHRIFCVPGDLTYDPVRLPRIPRLPNLGGVQASEEPDARETSIVEIAALATQLIALTNKGHVLKFRDLITHAPPDHAPWGWEYLEWFSEPSKIALRLPSRAVNSPRSLAIPRIGRITAQSCVFAAYSTGAQAVILMGTNATRSGDPPSPAGRLGLPDDALVAFVRGDEHYAALSADGTLRTWGSAHGALGLGVLSLLPPGAVKAPARGSNAPPIVVVPSRVRFGPRTQRTHCIGVAAARSHMGALVVILPPEDDEQCGLRTRRQRRTVS